jgi:hypothetical protein
MRKKTNQKKKSMRSYSTTADPAIHGQDNITVCPGGHPFQCPYATNTPVCAREPKDCLVKGQGVPFSTADGNSFGLVPVANPSNDKNLGWCGGNTNKHMPAWMTWTRECQSTMNDIPWYNVTKTPGNPLTQMMQIPKPF